MHLGVTAAALARFARGAAAVSACFARVAAPLAPLLVRPPFGSLRWPDDSPAAHVRMELEHSDFVGTVESATGSDGTASFQLPNPDPTNSGTTRYSVFARALGKPGGGADVTTCAEWLNPTTGLLEEVCSLAVLELRRSGNGGKSSFTMVAAAGVPRREISSAAVGSSWESSPRATRTR